MSMTLRRTTAGTMATLGAAVAAGALSAGCGSPSTRPANTHGQGKNGLELFVSKATYAAGEQISITVKLTNKSAAPCKMIKLTEGTVTIGAMMRDGKPVVPDMTTGTYINGMTEWLLQNIVTLPPGDSVSVPWVSDVGEGSNFRYTLETRTMARGGMADVAVWPVRAQGTYKLTVNYAVPSLDERAPKDLCRFTDTATIGFTVTGGT